MVSVLAVEIQGSLGHAVQAKEEVMAGLSEQREPWDKSPPDSTSASRFIYAPSFTAAHFPPNGKEILCLQLTATFPLKM